MVRVLVFCKRILNTMTTKDRRVAVNCLITNGMCEHFFFRDYATTDIFHEREIVCHYCKRAKCWRILCIYDASTMHAYMNLKQYLKFADRLLMMKKK